MRNSRAWIVWMRGLHAVCAACIVGLALTPGGQMPSIKVSDKLAHMAAYFVLGLLTFAAYRTRRSRFWWLVGAVALGIGLELAQDLVPRRQASFLDAVANTAGVALATALIFIGRSRRPEA